MSKSRTPTKAPSTTTDQPTTHTTAKPSESTTSQTLPIAPNSQLTVTLSWSTIEPAYQKSLRRYARQAKVDGFRKGKVPPELVEQMVNQQSLIESVLQEVLPTAYSQAVKDANKKPISQPEVEPVKTAKNSDWEIIVHFAEAPQITLGKYQDIVKKARQAAEKEIAQAEQELKDQAASTQTEPATVPADGSAEAKPTSPPQPTTLTDAQKDDRRTRQIFRQLVAELQPQIPELLVRREADRELRRLLEQLDQLKLSVESYLQSRQLTAEQLRLEYLSAAATSLQLEFILAEIGKSAQIKVEDQEIDQMMAQVFGPEVSDEQRRNPDYRTYLFHTLAKQKIVQHLLSLS